MVQLNIEFCMLRHYHKPYLPEINGLKNFQGQVMHSCDYRVPEKFEGKNVLLIGAKVSGNDLACEIAPFANQVLKEGRWVYAHH